MSRAASALVGVIALVVLGASADAAREATADATRQTTSSPGPDLGGGRLDHTATRLADGRTLVAGGSDGISTMSSAVLLDPVTRRVTATGTLQTARSHHTATLLGDGRVLIAGGFMRSSPAERTAPLNSAEIYDPATGAFTLTGGMTSARLNHSAVLLANGRVLVCGGNGELASGATPPLATAEVFDPQAGRFAAAGTMTIPRTGHSATLLKTGRVLVTELGTAELYDPATDRFSRTASPLARRIGHTATLLGNGQVLLVGGTFAYASLATAELYDPLAAAFRPTGNLSTARTKHTATLLDDGRVLVTGGYVEVPTTLPDGRSSPSRTATPTAEIYDPAAGAFSSVESLGVARGGHAAVPFQGGVWISGGADRGVHHTSEFFLTVAQDTARAAPTGNRPSVVRGEERLYTNPAHGWSVSYPQDWRVNDQSPTFVEFRGAGGLQGGLAGVHTRELARDGMSLDEFANSFMAVEARLPGFRILSRTPTTLRDGTAALEVVNVLGQGTVGKSRKVFAMVGGTGFCVNAETFLESWPQFDAAFDRIIGSLSLPPFWQLELARARRVVAAGNYYTLPTPSGVFVFYNNPQPFCFMYAIPGEWVTAPEPSAWRSKDGGALVGVLFRLPQELEGLPGRTLADRALNGITQRYEQGLGRKLTARFVPLESTALPARTWTAAPLKDADRTITVPPKVVVDLSPRGVVEITIRGTTDLETLARRIIETLKTTSDSACYWPVLEGMLKAAK